MIEAKGIAKSEEIINGKLTPQYIQWYNIKTLGQLAASGGTKTLIMPYNSNKSIMLNAK